MDRFNPQVLNLTKYLFYTGKGGVGKTSMACATALSLADHGKKSSFDQYGSGFKLTRRIRHGAYQ